MSTYSLHGYTSMITDPVRVDAYVAALREAITPGCTVVEIGAGTGFFTVLAARLGAGVVHAIEPDDSIQVARELAEANGVGDRIVFHTELSTRVELDPPADVLFCDLRGVLPLFSHHVDTIADARARLLKPGGVQIPLRDRVWLAPVSAPGLWADRVRPWGEADHGVDLTPTARRLGNLWSKARLEPKHVAAEPSLWTELDWATVTDPGVRGSAEWRLDGGRTLHGVAAWFDTELVEGVGFSNAPDAAPALYGHAFFPFPEPLGTAPGDRLEVDLRAHPVGEDYVWEWRTTHGPADGGDETRWSQSTLQGTVLTLEHLHRGAEGHRPRLSEEGRIDAFVLAGMDGTATVGELSRRLLEAFPARFRDYKAALDRVSELSRERSE